MLNIKIQSNNQETQEHIEHILANQKYVVLLFLLLY